MAEKPKQGSARIVQVLLSVRHDVFHGGYVLSTKLRETTGCYRVSLTRIRQFPHSGEREF